MSRSERLRELVAAGAWDEALRVAAGHLGRSDDALAIERAHEATLRPEFYRGLGRDPAVLRAAGIAALRRLFGAR
jgi:hypothetical protein